MPKKGYKQTIEHRLQYNRKGKNNPNYGKHPVMTNEWKEKIRLGHLGEKAYNYIDGRSNKDYFCENCKCIVTKSSGVYGSGFCGSCIKKIHWKNKEFKEKMSNIIRDRQVEKLSSEEAMTSWLRIMRAGLKIKPNKPETFLIELLKNLGLTNYKYVGDGSFWIERFNPDFIHDDGQKKIIEFFGQYWHSRPDYNERDKRRLKTYKKYGYKTLIISEKHLTDLDKLTLKLKSFNESV